MPPANMDRKHAKRELDRAVGNIAWTVQHLQTVRQGFYDASIYLAELESEIPESYETTITALDEITAACLAIAETIRKVDETI